MPLSDAQGGLMPLLVAAPAKLGWDGASWNEAPSLKLETTTFPENKPYDDKVYPSNVIKTCSVFILTQAAIPAITEVGIEVGAAEGFKAFGTLRETRLERTCWTWWKKEQWYNSVQRCNNWYIAHMNSTNSTPSDTHTPDYGFNASGTLRETSIERTCWTWWEKEQWYNSVQRCNNWYIAHMNSTNSTLSDTHTPEYGFNASGK